MFRNVVTVFLLRKYILGTDVNAVHAGETAKVFQNRLARWFARAIFILLSQRQFRQEPSETSDDFLDRKRSP
jgi:hypothetical protein